MNIVSNNQFDYLRKIEGINIELSNFCETPISVKWPDLHVDAIQQRRDDDIVESLNKANKEIERLTEINEKLAKSQKYKWLKKIATAILGWVIGSAIEFYVQLYITT